MIYAVPGVPYEMADMFERAILPDLAAKLAERGGGGNSQSGHSHVGHERVRVG